MLKFVDCPEKDEQSVVENIINYFGSGKTLVSLRKLDFITDNSCLDVYIVSKLVGVLVPLTTREDWTYLILVFQEVHSCNEVKDGEGLLFRTVFYNKFALAIDKAIRSGRLFIGNLFVVHKPTIVLISSQNSQLPNREDLNSRLVIEVNNDQTLIYVWQFNNLAYLHCYSKRLTNEYKHLDIFYVDNTRSSGHIIEHLLCLIRGKGEVVEMKQIPNSSINDPIVIAQLKKIVSTSEVNEKEAYVQLSFEEKFFKPNNSFRKNFVAFFCDEIAKEIKTAIEVKDIYPGDLFAICHPMFEKYTAAPVNIRFPPLQKKNLIVLQSRQANRERDSTLCLTDLNINTCEAYTENVSSQYIEFVNCKAPTNEIDTLTGIARSMEKYGTIKSIDAMLKEKTPDNKCCRGLVLSQFLKLLNTLKTFNEGKKVLLFFREIRLDSRYGPFFKVQVHNEIAESFYASLLRGRILKGDIIAFWNPIVWKNPGFWQRELLSDEPFSLEVCSMDQKPILVCRLFKVCPKIPVESSDNGRNKSLIENSASGLETVKLVEDKLQETLAKNNLESEPGTSGMTTKTVTRNKSVSVNSDHKTDTQPCAEEAKSQPGASITKTSSIAVEKDVSSTDIPALSTLGKHGDNDEGCDSIGRRNTRKRKAKHCWLELPKEAVKEEELLIVPFSITKPCLKDTIVNLVHGHCCLSCSKVFPYPVISWNTMQEPLCPHCLIRVKLMFRFEMDAFVMRTQQFLNVVLEGEKAEKFLGVTCRDFFKYKDCQKLALENIQEKIAESKQIKVCNLRLKDVTSYSFR